MFWCSSTKGNPAIVLILIDYGFRAITTVLDVWGFSGLVAGSLEYGRAALQKMGETNVADKVVANGNGKAA